MLITLFFLFGIFGVIQNNINNEIIYENSSNNPIGPITNKVKIKQEINVEDAEINNISIQVATYGRINEGNLILKIYKNNNEQAEIGEALDIKSFENNKFVMFKFKTIKIKKGEKYYFTLESTATSENTAPAIWINTNEEYNSGLYINSEQVNGSICYMLGYQKSYFIIEIFVLVASILLCIILACFADEYSDKKSKTIGILFFIVSIIFIYFNRYVFYDEKQQINYYNLIILTSLVLYTSYSLFYNNYFMGKIINIYKMILLFIMPFISLVIIELFNDNLIYKMNYKVICTNYICVLILYIVIFILSNRINITIIIGNTICYIMSITYYYVLLFRGTPILPTDFYAVGTAVNVMKNYEFKFNSTILITLFVMLLSCIVSKNSETNRTDVDKIENKRRLTQFLFDNFKIGKIIMLSYFRVISLAIVVTIILLSNNIFDKIGMSANLWQQREGYHENGVVANFLINMKYLRTSKPKGYSTEKVSEIISTMSLNTHKKMIESNISVDKPNIIAIMNESFSDLNVIGRFNTNKDYMPFIHNLNKNTIKGNLLVSTMGGGTANTEWEFLTGNSMAFIPPGAIPYQQYIHTYSSSLASTLKNLKYNTIAMHPFDGSGWNRNNVYPLLGFDKFITMKDFTNPEVLRNSYISDKENYKKIIEKYKEKEESDRLFIFDVTIQNHGGYQTNTSIFSHNVYLTDESYSDVDEYLSLIKKSDEAFEELVDYFSNVNQPTVILMFGDHLPSLDTKFYERLYNKSLDNLTLEETQKEFTVPFVIWSNYDIEEKYINIISANYLSTLLLNTANQPLTDYNKFLEELNGEIPAINKNGYIDSEGRFYQLNEGENLTEINSYNILEYNNVFDTKNIINK